VLLGDRVATVAALTACATQMTSEGSKVELLTEQQASHCEQVKVVTVNQRLGPDKPGNAMKRALNEAAAAGANGFYVVMNSTDWAEGASVVGKAMRCK
jgi:hypothetical protein